MALEQAAWETIDLLTPVQRLIGLLNQRMARLMHLMQRVQRRNTRLTTTDTALTEADDILLVDTTAGNVTITLPSAALAPKVRFAVKKVGNDVNTVTVQRAGSDTVDFGTAKVWATYLEAYEFESAIVTAPATWGWLVL